MRPDAGASAVGASSPALVAALVVARGEPLLRAYLWAAPAAAAALLAAAW